MFGTDGPHPTSKTAAIVISRYFMDAVFVMRRSQLFKPESAANLKPEGVQVGEGVGLEESKTLVILH